MHRVVFVHLPKTGGTSFHNGVRSILGHDAVSENFLATNLSVADAARLGRFDVISGHISMTDVEQYFSDRLILTILREPVGRCLSWYYFARKPSTRAWGPNFVAAKQHSIEDFFGLDYRITYRNIFNRQVRQLGDHVLNVHADLRQATEKAKEVLRLALWVGRQESLADDIRLLAQRMPILTTLRLPMFNVTGDREKRTDLSPELLERIQELNQYDLELYSFACNL